MFNKKDNQGQPKTIGQDHIVCKRIKSVWVSECLIAEHAGERQFNYLHVWMTESAKQIIFHSTASRTVTVIL